MELTLWGCDVYTAGVDDRGIDFVIHRGTNCYYDVQVKSSRGMDGFSGPRKAEHFPRWLLGSFAPVCLAGSKALNITW